jgi:Phytanoyl-CoA dioxygenase (PhyH)
VSAHELTVADAIALLDEFARHDVHVCSRPAPTGVCDSSLDRTNRLMEMVPTNRDEVLPVEVPVAVDQQEAVAIELSRGDMSVHHPNIVHGSDANMSTSWRRGLTIRYIPTTTTRILDAEMSAAFVLRGNPIPGVNEYLPVPTYDPERHMAFDN